MDRLFLKSALFFACFLFAIIQSKAQDNIILKNGEKIDCKITGEDTANVYIVFQKDGNDINTLVYKKEIYLIDYGNQIF